MHDVVARILYRDISIKGYKSRRFLTTILSRSSTSELYGSYIRSFEYVTSNVDDACLTYPILCSALARSFDIRELSLRLPCDTTQFINLSLTKAHILRNSVDTILSADDFLRGVATASRLTLPHLQSLTINGEPALADIARMRKLKTLKIVDVLSFNRLSSVIAAIRGPSCTYPSLRSLTISFDITINERLFFALQGLHEVFPNLEEAIIHSRRVNALVSVIGH